MLSQSARTNLQVKLINDARKLLEKVQSQDANAASMDVSFDSFHSDPIVQNPEPASLSKFNDIMFIQKSQSEQQQDDDESISIGNLSYSPQHSERGDNFFPEQLDNSAMKVNSPYRVSHIHKSLRTLICPLWLPCLRNSSDEVQDLVEKRLEKLNSPSVCNADSIDGRHDDDDGDSASFESCRILSKDGNMSMSRPESFKLSSSQRIFRHSSSQRSSSSILQEVDSVISGRSDPFEADNASIGSLKSLRAESMAESMLSSAKNLIVS